MKWYTSEMKCPMCGREAYPWSAAFSDASGWDCPVTSLSIPAPGGCGWSSDD